MAKRGRHLLKHRNSTQIAVTLISGEAELYGIIKATAEAPGIQSWGEDLMVEKAVRIHVDSAAAIGIYRRRGMGCVRHAVGKLSVQEGFRRGNFQFFKVRVECNQADVIAKFVLRKLLDKHLEFLAV